MYVPVAVEVIDGSCSIHPANESEQQSPGRLLGFLHEAIFAVIVTVILVVILAQVPWIHRRFASFGLRAQGQRREFWLGMMAPVTASTRFCLMVGQPADKARTPVVFNEWAVQMGRDVVMLALSGDSEGVGPLFKAMRHWETCLGAGYVVRREPLVGTMTDGIGCVAAMMGHGAALGGADFLLIGAGGAGSAIALEVARRGAARIVVRDIANERRDALLDRLSTAFPKLGVEEEIPNDFRFDVACNATPLGMKAETVLPFEVERLPSRTLVVDAVPTPAMTPWLKAAEARGLKVQTGPEMVAGQFACVAGHLLDISLDRVDPAVANRTAIG